MDFAIKHFSVLWKIFKFLLPAIPMTLKITIASFLLALILGLLIALVRTSHFKLFQIITKIYIDIIRVIPLLVQIFFLYFGLGKIFNLSRFAAGVVAISICYSAFLCEIFRAGIEAIPKGQIDASKSLGMNTFQTMKYVILPQALRIVIPPILNDFISCLKDSSLVSIIGLRELTRAGREFNSHYFTDFKTWFVVGFIYFIMVLILSRITHFIEKRYKIIK